MQTSPTPFKIVNFHRFLRLGGDRSLAELRDELQATMIGHEMKGTILLAEEGINASIAGVPERVDEFVACAGEILGCEFDIKESFHDEMPFDRTEVRIKPEIVTLKRAVDVTIAEGTHVGPKEWNELISDPNVIVLDTRNDYEVAAGRFRSAIDPKVEKFSDMPYFVDSALSGDKDKKIAMYCTGGIRCEKFAPYLLEQGFREVFQLEGGILRYLESIPEKESLWDGECFVFDRRISVDSELKRGSGPDASQVDKHLRSSFGSK